AGPINLTVLGEYSRTARGAGRSQTDYVNNKTGATETGAAAPTASDPASNRFKAESSALAAETNVPLVGARQKIPLISQLDFFASGRISEQTVDSVRQATSTPTVTFAPYSGTFRPHLYALGARYDIIEGIAFRGSRTIGFKPPTFAQLTPGNPPSTSM